jgi:hypothetical protein
MLLIEFVICLADFVAQLCRPNLFFAKMSNIQLNKIYDQP